MKIEDYLRRYAADWILCLVLQAYVFSIGIRTQPFLREFNILDPSIQHPFTEHEQVNDWQCLMIATLIPGVIIALHFLASIKCKVSRMTRNQLHLTHITILGLAFSVTISGFFTVILKNWISRPRPDFLARCVPDLSKIVEGKTTYTTEICTGDHMTILEGLRSTPSGHSSLAFSGLHYITLWLMVQMDVFAPQFHVWKVMLCSFPEWVAVWVALSRTQDYRHHFGDILMGGSLGIVVCHLVWRKMFRGKEPVYLHESTEPTLPLYTQADD